MSNKEIMGIDPNDPTTYNKILLEFIEGGIAPIANPNLQQVLSVGNTTGGINIDANGGSVIATHILTNSLEGLIGNPDIFVDANLNIVNERNLTIGTSPASIITSTSINTYNATQSSFISPSTIEIVDNNLVKTTTITASDITSNAFIKVGGTNLQYLMADGSITTNSGTNAGSNIYLYNNRNTNYAPPIASGDIKYNNAVQDNATIVYISHLTRDTIDIDVFLAQINLTSILYIQDQNNSLNFIYYDVIGTPTIIPNNYISVPVVKTSSGGTGSTTFGNSHNIILSILTNQTEINNRITTLETKTQNQSATALDTIFLGKLVATDISAGSIGSLPYQSATNTTTFLSVGSTGQFLTVSGGVPSWNSLTATSPIDFSSNTVSIPKANATTNGYLSSTDWNTFNTTVSTPSLQQVLTVGNTALTSNIDISAGLATRYLGEVSIKRSATNIITTTSSGTILNLLPKIALSTIPSATKTNMLYYDTSTKEVSYGALPTVCQTFYGDGADGSVSFDIANQYPQFASFDGFDTYTLIRDVYATTIFVGSTVTVITGGYRLFAYTSINNSGTIHNNGYDGNLTVAGAGGLGGFFKAGGSGATGLGTASAGAIGNAQPTPVANSWVGGLGGRGGQGRASNTTFVGGMILTSNVTVPANADGGSRLTSNFVNYMTRYIVSSTNFQMTPSIGGGSGAKSIIGTLATSGGGGGGGGICFVGSPIIFGTGLISANGGQGGFASGTGGNFGGGGGGGGGITCIICRSITNTTSAIGGNEGAPIYTGTGDYPVATSNGTNTTLTATITLTPTVPLSRDRLYMITFHLQKTAGISGGINGISGYGMSWNLISGSRITFDTILLPTRVQETWYGYATSVLNPDLIQDDTITIQLSDINTSARVIIDEITNIDLTSSPISSNISTNSSNSATSLTVTLSDPVIAGNMVYSVFTRATGTLPVAGANNTIVNNQTTAPLMVSEVNTTGQQANAMSHTTASAIAGFSVVIFKTDVGASGGSRGWNGKVIRIFG
jgi:hypothetical protein